MTDETDFALFAEPNKQNDRVWTDDQANVPPVEVVKHSAKLKVWGGVSAFGKTKLYFYDGTMDMKKYLKVLEKMKPEAEAFFGDDDWCFQHDGASAHKAKTVNKWLEENVPEHITSGPAGEWCANSPDLNYIENVWAIMDEKLEEKPPKTLNALKRRVKKIWRDLDQEVIKNMARGMKKRLKSVIKNKGGFIGK